MGELRASLVWHDEVMDERVGLREITIGPSAKATFVIPEIGLPESFAIVRPGARGVLLTLAPGMRGTVSVEGVAQDVAGLVAGGFYATPISGADWGVIELGATCKLFFQFVARDELPMAGPQLEPEARASLAFSVVLHAALLLTTYRLAEAASPFVYPGPRALTAAYLVTRLETAPPAPAASHGATGPAPTITTVSPPPTPLPPTPRWHEPAPAAPAAPTVHGPLTPGAQSVIDSIRSHRLDLGGVQQLGGETGHPPSGPAGPSTRGGDPTGPGGPRIVRHDGPLDTGTLRKGSVCAGDCAGAPPVDIAPMAPPGDDGPTLSKKDIEVVVRSGSGRLRACYQRQLDRHDSLSGTITLRFVIGADGKVQSTAVAGDSVENSEVTDCVRRNIQMLRFPARGGAVVTYPFVFAPG